MIGKSLLPVILLIIFSGYSINSAALTPENIPTDLKWAEKTGAKKMPQGKKIFNVSAYGAKNDGSTLNTKAIQAAIDACVMKRGGTVENIYIHDITMNNVGTMLRATMDWNPSYSYSTLPKEFSYVSIPSHWKVMLQKRFKILMICRQSYLLIKQESMFKKC
jgi:hypothetical protein